MGQAGVQKNKTVLFVMVEVCLVALSESPPTLYRTMCDIRNILLFFRALHNFINEANKPPGPG